MVYEHMRPNFLPSIARLFCKPVKEGPTTDPHGSKPSGFLGSLLRLSYYSLDYVFGYRLKIYPALVRQPSLYIFDRYFYDYYIDSYRGKVSLPKWIIKFYGFFIPSPDIILCLGTDVETIHARKPELSIEEFKRQVKELKAFCKNNKKAVWIDTGCSIEESVDKALEAITSRMASRYEK
jgi:thymidylate kinase